jgi:flagellar hook-length control protein FliK
MQVNVLTINTQINSDDISKSVDSKSTQGSDFKDAMNKVMKPSKDEPKKTAVTDKNEQLKSNTTSSINDEKSEDDKIDIKDIASLISALLNGSISIQDLKQMTLPETANKIIDDLNSVKLIPENLNFSELISKVKNNEASSSDIAKLLTENIKDSGEKIDGFLKLAESQNIITTKDIPKIVENIKLNLTNKASDIVNVTTKNMISNTVQSSDKLVYKDDILTTIKKVINEVYKNPEIENPEIENAEDQMQIVKSDNNTTDKNLIPEKEEKVSVKLETLKEESPKNNLTSSDSKEESFLKDLVSEKDDDSKISRATSFVTQFKTIANEVKQLNPETAPINKANIVADMIKTVKYMQDNDVKNLTVKLVPKELGEITIKLVMENGMMKANITATNKEAYNLLNSNLQDLNGKLQNSDIKIQNFTINIYNEDTTFFKQGSNENSSGNSNNKNNKNAEAIDAATEENSDSSISSALESSILKFA